MRLRNPVKSFPIYANVNGPCGSPRVLFGADRYRDRMPELSTTESVGTVTYRAFCVHPFAFYPVPSYNKIERKPFSQDTDPWQRRKLIPNKGVIEKPPCELSQ